MANEAAERKVYAVTEITRRIKSLIESDIGYVWVEGELSGVKSSGPGHIYFSLKDEKAVLNSAFFRGSQRGLTVELKDGLKIRAYGEISVYEPRGSYQLIVRKVEEAGKGSLQEAFEKLKQKLAREGLFDDERKQGLPRLPQRIGIVTSPTGAAIRDILNVLNRRFPNVHVLIAPARVQGEGSAAEIATAIQRLDEAGSVDVMIVGRGGGSLEDLWAFNEEVVARAIAAATTPIISAVGHEVDFTIADFVADLRAPTPSAAAEIVVGRKEAFEEQLAGLRRRLAGQLENQLLLLKNRFIAASGSYVFREPENLLRHYRQKVGGLASSMGHRSQRLLQAQQQRMDELSLRRRHVLETRVGTARQELRRFSSQLQALNPANVLRRGYSMTRLAGGRIVQNAEHLQEGAEVETLLSKGSFRSTVTDVKKDTGHGG